jgi:ankyrin repeat protein
VLASSKGHVDISRFLIDQGGTLPTRVRSGCTRHRQQALDCVTHSIVEGSPRHCEKQGADIDSRNHVNKTAADLASDHGQIEVASFLAEYAGDENVRNKICLDATLHDSDDGDGTEHTSFHAAVI